MTFKRRCWEASNLSRGWEALNALPEWIDTWRPQQISALEQITDGFERGARVVVVDAPPGSGKTVLGEATRLLLEGKKNAYVCHSKALQEQFHRDFPYSHVLKGRANYPTEIFEDSFPEISASDCTKHDGSCEYCESTDSCPYESAKRYAYQSEVAVLNTSYFLTEANYVGGFTDRDFCVLDECDLLEKELMGFVEARVPKSYVERYRLGEPKHKTKEESWKEWLDESVLPKLREGRGRLRREIQDVQGRQRYRRLSENIDKLSGVSKKLGSLEDDRWVAETDRVGWTFKPVQVAAYGEELIWKHSKRFLLMSGSVVSTSTLMNSLGFFGERTGIVVPSSFPPSSRKVRIIPTGSLSKRSPESERAAVFEKLSSIVRDHTDERVLVHSVSHRLANEARQALERSLRTGGHERQLFSVEDGADRERVVSGWLGSRDGVFLSPSMDRGVDLKGDLCRVQVILKVPFPNIGDKQVEARVYRTKGGRLWYAVETTRTLIQATGRVTRSEEDWGQTYILDQEFLRFWRQWKGLFPGWWKEAVQFR